MDLDTIIRMGREAGIEFQSNTGVTGRMRVTTCGGQSVEKLVRLIELAVAAEREACAQIVRRRTGIPEDAIRRGTGVRDQLVIAGEQIIEAIRARGTT